jgi:hypothetical protein
MSAEYKNTDLNKLAKDAERDLNSNAAKHGSNDPCQFPHFPSLFSLHGHPALPTSHWPYPIASDSGVNESVTAKFPGSTVEYGTGASNNRTIPESEGGSVNPATGQMYKAGEFAKGGVAPVAWEEGYAKRHGGEDGVDSNTKWAVLLTVRRVWGTRVYFRRETS